MTFKAMCELIGDAICGRIAIIKLAEWNEVSRLAELGAAVESMPPRSWLSHNHARPNLGHKWVFRIHKPDEHHEFIPVPPVCPTCPPPPIPEYAYNGYGETPMEALEREK